VQLQQAVQLLVFLDLHHHLVGEPQRFGGGGRLGGAGEFWVGRGEFVLLQGACAFLG
jgi:hypothetical protein